MKVALALERLESGTAYDPLSQEALSCPYPMYQRLRRKDPVHKSRLLNAWVLSRYEDVECVTQDNRRFSNDNSKAPKGPPLRGDRITNNATLVGTDPPDHGRIRSVLARAFAPKAVDRLGGTIDRAAGHLLDGLSTRQRFDFMEHYGRPLPLLVMCQVLGLPIADASQLEAWLEDMEDLLVPGAAAKPVAVLRRSREALVAYLQEAMGSKDPPKECVISDLQNAQRLGRLGQEEAMNALLLLLGAGTMTTAGALGNAIHTMVHHHDIMILLHNRTDAIPAAVEEFLRFDTSVQLDRRIALEDVRIGNRRIRRGEHVILLVGSAAHDPDMFEEPEAIRLDRSERNSPVFGRGIHYCLGATLARLEMQIALTKFLERFPKLYLDGDVIWSNNPMIRGPKLLPLRTSH